MKVFEFLETHVPFNIFKLRDIALGVVADPRVNADVAKTVGEMIIETIFGQIVANYVKKKNQVVTMGNTKAIRIGGEDVIMDPMLVFQRFSTAGRNTGNLANPMSYDFSVLHLHFSSQSM